jgi:uncharacterized repeat protein (TIGR04138 family)
VAGLHRGHFLDIGGARVPRRSFTGRKENEQWQNWHFAMGSWTGSAYLFVLAALEFCQQRLDERRHINGRELALACRDLALDRYGVMAGLVLDHWGVRSSADIGAVVFTLVDLGLLMSQPTDTRDEFAEVFDFGQAFEREYPWSGALTV